MKHNEKRRSVLKNIGMGMAGLLGIASVKAAPSKSKKKWLVKLSKIKRCPYSQEQ
jgi:hypothetical protein